MKKCLSFIGSVLLGCYIVPIYHFVSNYPQVPLKDTILIIALFGAIVVGLVGFLWLLFRDINKVSFLMYGGAIIFWFSHPFAKYIAGSFTLPQAVANCAWPLLFICCALGILSLFFILKFCPKFVKNINTGLGVFVFILSGLLLINVCRLTFFNTKGTNSLYQNNKQNIAKGTYPNIYHILLDAHPNQKAMEIIGGNLKPFYNELEALGFVTFPKSHSNYPATQWSVASMLNMDYLQDNWKNMSFDNCRMLIGNSKVFENFLQQGYNVLFSTDNVMVKSLYPSVKEFISSKNSSMFCSLYDFLCSTPLKHVFEKIFSKKFQQIVQNNIKKVFVSLKSGKELYGEKMNFFYAHVLCPHEPVVFSKMAKNLAFQGFIMKYDASYMLAPETHRAFCENVCGIDNIVLESIKEILKQYGTESIKPIIVLHSDHSILYCARDLKNPFITPDTVYGNLLALYIPDEWKQDAKDLKFINLYRWIFNHLFGDNFEYFKENMQK